MIISLSSFHVIPLIFSAPGKWLFDEVPYEPSVPSEAVCYFLYNLLWPVCNQYCQYYHRVWKSGAAIEFQESVLTRDPNMVIGFNQ